MVVWILIILTGLIGLYLTIGWIVKRKKCSQSVTATVSDIEYNRAGFIRKDVRNYYPVYRFVMNGQEFNVRPDAPERTNRWKKGEEVVLKVNPGNPDVFRVGNETSDLVYGILSLGLCLLFVCVLYVR